MQPFVILLLVVLVLYMLSKTMNEGFNDALCPRACHSKRNEESQNYYIAYNKDYACC